MDIVSLGELLVDMFPAEIGVDLADVSAFRPVPGGAPANVAVSAARLGARSAFIGKVGDDAFGRRLAGVLAAEGVGIDGLRYDGYARTSINFMAQPDRHSYTCLFYRNPGADMLLSAEELDFKLLRATRVLHFGSLSLAQEPSRGATLEAIRAARAAGALISFDVNYRPTLWRSPQAARSQVIGLLPQVGLLKVNEEELALLAGTEDLDAGSRALLAYGPALCVVTLGPEGSFLRTVSAAARVPGFPVQTVDATGCGDAFIAGLLCHLLAQGDALALDRLTESELAAAGRYANAVGALTATAQGVIPALPRAAEVGAYLEGLGAG